MCGDEMTYETEAQKHTFYVSKEWRSLRLQALERDHYECQECKRQGYVHAESTKQEGKRKPIKVNVHHIKEIEHNPESALELDNLETICPYHHNRIHGKIFKGKVNKWKQDEKW